MKNWYIVQSHSSFENKVAGLIKEEADKAKIAEKFIDNAGEYNGFLKIEPQARILSNPLKFKDGFLIISENWDLEIDRDKLEKYSTRKETIYK